MQAAYNAAEWTERAADSIRLEQKKEKDRHKCRDNGQRMPPLRRDNGRNENGHKNVSEITFAQLSEQQVFPSKTSSKFDFYR